MQKQGLKDMQRFRNRHVIVSVLIMSAISLMIVALFRIMYSSAKLNILNAWENNVIQLAKSTEYYLARPTDAIEYSSAHVEEMIAEGKTNQEIGAHLVNEKHIFATLVKNNYTGVYAYCRGEYRKKLAERVRNIAGRADSLRKTFRDSDVVFRLGGDEFAVFAPGIELEESKDRLIERLHDEISRINIPELQGHPVTVSAGTADYGGEPGDTYEALYQRADQKMYENKRKKRKE